MSRLARLLTPVNSPELRSFVINKPHICPNPTFGFLAGISPNSSSRTILSFRLPHKINSQISPSKFYKFTTSTTVPAGRREPHPQGTEMESNTGSQSTESDKPAVDGFISVDNASPESKSNSNFEGIVQSNEEESGNDDGDGDGDGDGEGEGDDQVEIVPEEIMKSVVSLSCESTAEGGFCDVYLIGTAHVSQESCREVAALISYLKPEVVFLELCSNRVAVLTPQNLKVPTMREMVDMWKKNNNAFGILYSWFLAKVATKLEVLPGSEFRVAFEEAKKYGGKVVLGDRPVQITLRRTWGKMPLWHKTKLLYSLLFQGLFLPSSDDFNKMLKDMDDIDILTLVIQEMSKEFPTLMETLVHERDQYMSSTLLRVAKEHSSVVAVVGKGHLQGIKKYWKQPVEVNNLMQMPQPKATVSVAKIIASLGVAAAGVAIISGIYISSKK